MLICPTQRESEGKYNPGSWPFPEISRIPSTLYTIGMSNDINSGLLITKRDPATSFNQRFQRIKWQDQFPSVVGNHNRRIQEVQLIENEVEIHQVVSYWKRAVTLVAKKMGSCWSKALSSSILVSFKMERHRHKSPSLCMVSMLLGRKQKFQSIEKVTMRKKQPHATSLKHMNPKFRRLFHLPSKNIVGQHLSEIERGRKHWHSQFDGPRLEILCMALIYRQPKIEEDPRPTLSLTSIDGSFSATSNFQKESTWRHVPQSFRVKSVPPSVEITPIKVETKETIIQESRPFPPSWAGFSLYRERREAEKITSVMMFTIGNATSNPKNQHHERVFSPQDSNEKRLCSSPKIPFPSGSITGGVDRNGKYVKKRDDIKPWIPRRYAGNIVPWANPRAK